MEISILHHRFWVQQFLTPLLKEGLTVQVEQENVATMFQGKKKDKDFLQPYERVDDWKLGASCCINQIQDLI